LRRGFQELEGRVQRLAEARHLVLTESANAGGYELVDPVTRTPLAAVGLAPGNLVELERRLKSGHAAHALERCHGLFARAAKRGLTLEYLRVNGAWIWNAREVSGLPVAGDLSYRELGAFLDARGAPSALDSEAGAHPDRDFFEPRSDRC
jgi:hypothetical protein